MYSQLGQDILVVELLEGMCNGFFLDSGATNGIRASNTLLLESVFDWQGICIEPNEFFFAELVKNRHCYCLNCCLYSQEGTVNFVEANTLGGILDEYDPVHLKYTKKICELPTDSKGRLITVPKPARTVRSVLRECKAPPIIDYWSLDTEGSELAILKSFPFDEYSFRVLTVEHNYLPVREKIKIFLESHGYWRIQELGIDDCYVKNIKLLSPSWQSSVWRKPRNKFSF